jgi:ribose 5-phosphate isomerase B
MRVAFGTDESTPVTDDLMSDLQHLGHEVLLAAEDIPWAEAGAAVGHLVASGQADVGIVCCFTGTGVTMAANKVPGVRAALCVDPETAQGARRWNDANVLGLSLRLATSEVAREIVEAFFRTSFDLSEAGQVAQLS